MGRRFVPIVFVTMLASILSPHPAVANDRAGSISGTVTDASGSPISVCVTAMDLDWNWLAETYTDEDGNYTLSGIRGAIVVRFGCTGGYAIAEPVPYVVANSHDPSGSDFGYVSEYYDDVTEFDDATVLEVSAGQAITGIDAELLPAGGIVGEITTADAGEVEACVSAFGLDWSYAGSGYSYGDAYSISGLAPGSYKLYIEDCSWPQRYYSEWFEDAATFHSATPIEVSGGEGTQVDVVLDPRPAPDLAVTHLAVKPVPVRTDGHEGPSLGHQRTVEVRAQNLGEGPGWAWFVVWVKTHSDNSVRQLLSEDLYLEPGQAFERTLRWDATGYIGDATIIAHACYSELDSNPSNDRREVESYALVGGSGVGVSSPTDWLRSSYEPFCW